jgi:hypothetical protein
MAEKMLETLMSAGIYRPTWNEWQFYSKTIGRNKNSNSGVDVPQIYADYYYLEALNRYAKNGLQQQSSIPDIVIHEDAGDTIIIEDLSIYFNPGNNQEINYSIYSTSELNATITNENQVLVNPLPNYHGVVEVTLVASSEEYKIQSRFTITVTPVNDAPEAPLLSHPINNAVLESVKTFFRWEAAHDVDGDSIVYTLSIEGPGLDTLVYPIENTGWRFNGEEYLEPNATYQWKVIASDGIEKVTSEIFSFSIPLELSTMQVQVAQKVSLYPTLFTNKLFLYTNTGKDMQVTIRLINLAGQEILNQTIHVPGVGENRIKIQGINSYSLGKRYLFIHDNN